MVSDDSSGGHDGAERRRGRIEGSTTHVVKGTRTSPSQVDGKGYRRVQDLQSRANLAENHVVRCRSSHAKVVEGADKAQKAKLKESHDASKA